MTKRLAVAALLLALGPMGPALADEPARDVTVGYLGLANDVRYFPEVAYTRIQLAPADKPVEGARMGFDDLKIVTDAVGINMALDEQQASTADDAVSRMQAMVKAGEQFIILDLPGDAVAAVANAAKGLDVTLINATAPEDSLRAMCLPNLLHSGASDRMVADTYMQFLRHRNWLKVLMLVGQKPRDREMADAFQQSAQRLGVTIVDRRTFTLSTDPANRESNNSLLVTGNADYDVVYIADSEGEYSRYLEYSTLLPRPVIGSSGLTATEWAWTWDRDGATQVTLRFQRASEGQRWMTGADWSTWIAAKSVATAYAKSRTSDPDKIAAYLKGKRFNIDGSKGLAEDYRPWDHQLRMPMVLTTGEAVIEAAPFPEFLHQVNELDTLGVDEPESPCKAQ